MEQKLGFVKVDMTQLKALSAIMSAALVDMEPGHVPLAVAVVTVPEGWLADDANAPDVAGILTYVHQDVDTPEALAELGRMITRGLINNAPKPLPTFVN